MNCVICEEKTNPNDENANYCDKCYELKEDGLSDDEIERLKSN